MQIRGAAISLAVHVAVVGTLLAAARQNVLHAPTSVVLAETPRPKKVEAKPAPKPPQPRPKPPPPRPAPQSAKTPAAAPPAPAARAAVAAAALQSFTLSNDGPGGVAVPVPHAVKPPTRVAQLDTRGARLRKRHEAEAETCDETPTKPRPIYKVEIEYLPSARADGIEGRLVLRIFVAADGSVERVEVLSKVDPALDAAAIAAVKQWRFEPSQACGRSVGGGVYTIARTFELGD